MWTIPQSKTATGSRGKKTVSETEHERVVRIPLIIRFRPIVVQPQAIVVVFQLEDVRVALGVGFVRYAIHDTAHLVRAAQEIGLYFTRDRIQ